MKIDELINALTAIRGKHGNLLVVAEDGMDPSDLQEVKTIEAGIHRFFGPGFLYDERLAVLVST